MKKQHSAEEDLLFAELVPDPGVTSIFEGLIELRARRLAEMGVPSCIGQPPWIMPEEKLRDLPFWAVYDGKLRRKDREITLEELHGAQMARLSRAAASLQEQLEKVEQCAMCRQQLLCLLLRGKG